MLHLLKKHYIHSLKVGNMVSLLDLSLENNNIKDLKALNNEEGFKTLKVK